MTGHPEAVGFSEKCQKNGSLPRADRRARCNHANRLKARSYVKHTLFFGYCNGHGMYFPTIEAASEGGYGANPGVSLAELGAGERMMDKALLNIYLLQGKFARERR